MTQPYVYTHPFSVGVFFPPHTTLVSKICNYEKILICTKSSAASQHWSWPHMSIGLKGGARRETTLICVLLIQLAQFALLFKHCKAKTSLLLPWGIGWMVLWMIRWKLMEYGFWELRNEYFFTWLYYVWGTYYIFFFFFLVPIIFSSKNIYGIGCTGLEVRV